MNIEKYIARQAIRQDLSESEVRALIMKHLAEPLEAKSKPLGFSAADRKQIRKWIMADWRVSEIATNLAQKHGRTEKKMRELLLQSIVLGLLA